MKKHFAALGFLFAVSAVSASVSAQAGEVDFTASPAGIENMGILTVGQYGTISNGYSNVSDLSSISGFLPSMEQIVFTYTLNNLVANSGFLVDQGSYNYTVGATNYNGFSIATSYSPSIGSGLVVATASLPTLSGGTSSVANNSGGIVTFNSLFSGLFSPFNAQSFTLTYNVVSTVPLPASAALFGSIMLALFGFSWFKRRKHLTSAI